MGIIRFLLIGAMGLGALYMIHLLAQDYNKIRPAAKLASYLISKRDVQAVSDSNGNSIENFEIDSPKILKFDPFKCALALICQVAAGAKSENPEALNIKALIEYSMEKGAPEEIDKAFRFGATNSNRSSKCYQEYPFCPYSAKVMLKLLEVHSTVFGST